MEIVMMLANTQTHTHTCKSRDNFHVFIHPNLYYIRVYYVSWMASLPQKHRVNICFAKQNTWKHTCVTLNVRILYRYIMNISHRVIHLEWFKKKNQFLSGNILLLNLFNRSCLFRSKKNKININQFYWGICKAICFECDLHK